MTFQPIYEPDFKRLIPAIINDSRNTIPETTNQIGMVIKTYFDAQIASVGLNGIVYRIEGEAGVLAGYFVLQVVNKIASLSSYQFRPAFQSFSAQLLSLISTFIQENGFLNDILY